MHIHVHKLSIWHKMSSCPPPCKNVFHILPHSVQLGNFSPAWNLAILQVGPQSGMILHWGPATRPPPALVENQTFMQYRRLEFGGCLKGVWRMSKRCLEGVWLVSARYREGVGRVQRRCLWRVKIDLNPNIFFYNILCFVTSSVICIFSEDCPDWRRGTPGISLFCFEHNARVQRWNYFSVLQKNIRNQFGQLLINNIVALNVCNASLRKTHTHFCILLFKTGLVMAWIPTLTQQCIHRINPPDSK